MNSIKESSKWRITSASLALTAFVLLCSGSIKPLQLISIASALPFLLIMAMICISLVLEFRKNDT